MQGQVTIETVIITSILLSSIIAVLFYAYNVVESNSQNIEFSNAKILMKYLADAIEQISLGSGGARYVRIPVRSGAPGYVRDNTTLRIFVEGEMVFEDNPDIIIYRGGPLVSTVFEVIRPELRPEIKNELIVDLNDPIVVAYTIQRGGALIVIDTLRVRAGCLGIYTVMTAGGARKYHVYELMYTVLNVYGFHGTDGITIIVENQGIESQMKIYDGKDTITIRVEMGGRVVEKTLSPCVNESAYGSAVLIRIARLGIKGP